MNLTEILQQAEAGDASARARLIQASYEELRHLAGAKMTDERADHTLTSTALVHEVSMKILTDSKLPVTNRGQFFAYASKAMRHFLIDYARARGRRKRGGGRYKFSFEEALVAVREHPDELLALDEALEELGQFDPRKAELVDMKYFGGLSNQEIADALKISLATVKRDWMVAKLWLLNKLRAEPDEGDGAGREEIGDPL